MKQLREYIKKQLKSLNEGMVKRPLPNDAKMTLLGNLKLKKTINLIKKKLIRILDFYYSIIESLGVKFTNYAWHKRWCNREKGTGYKK